MRTPRLHDEDGAVAAMVILGIFALLATAVLAIDVGSMLHTRRGLIADADAAALAAAMALLEDDCDVAAAQDEAREVAATNDADTVVSFPPPASAEACGDGYGHVTVQANNPAELFFAPIFGIDEFSAGATSTATYGQIVSLNNLRPIGLCSGDVLTPEASPVLYSGAAQTVQRFRFVRPGLQLGQCGTASANWGWLDLDAGANGTPDLVDWLRDPGYPGRITLDGTTIEGTPGGRGKSTDNGPEGGALTDITCESPELVAGDPECPVIYVVVYDRVTTSTGNGGNNGGGGNGVNGGGGNGGGGNGGGGGGAKAEFHPVAFLAVAIRDHNNIGTGQDDGWLDLEVVHELTSGTIGPADPTFPLGLRGVQLCATEHSTRPC